MLKFGFKQNQLSFTDGWITDKKLMQLEEFSEVDCLAVLADGTMDELLATIGDNDDEPHGSLFVYFRIFAPLADNHVITSHVTGITRPILTFADDFRSFAMISSHL